MKGCFKYLQIRDQLTFDPNGSQILSNCTMGLAQSVSFPDVWGSGKSQGDEIVIMSPCTTVSALGSLCLTSASLPLLLSLLLTHVSAHLGETRR